MHLGLTNFTSGKGKSDQKDSGMRPIEIFMCSVVSQCAVLLWNIWQACMLGRRQGYLFRLMHCLLFKPSAGAVSGTSLSPPATLRPDPHKHSTLPLVRRLEEWVTARGSAGCPSTSSRCLP